MLVEEYLSTLSEASPREKTYTKKAIEAIQTLLSERGKDWPDDSDYTEYRKSREEEGKDYRAINKDIERIQSYYQATKKGATPMLEKVNQSEIIEVEAENEQQPTNSTEPEISEPVKRGRKPKSAGEKPVQLSIYLKRELYEAVKDLIASRESLSETVSRLLDWYVKKNEAVLEARRLKMQELEAIQPADLN